jgi:hypothetical protein
MSNHYPGQKIKFVVASSFNHHPGFMVNASQSIRCKGKPCIEMAIMILPQVMQVDLNKIAPEGILPFSPISMHGLRSQWSAYWNHVLLRSDTKTYCLFDTGASRCVMSSSEARKLVGREVDFDKLPPKSVTLTDGSPVKGRLVWAFVSVVGSKSGFYLPFVVSDTFQTPTIISWKAFRKIFRFYLTSDQLIISE